MSDEERDRLEEELAQRITEACRGYADDFVAGELIASLGEVIGRAPYRDRPAILTDVIAHLSKYVSEIPP